MIRSSAAAAARGLAVAAVLGSCAALVAACGSSTGTTASPGTSASATTQPSVNPGGTPVSISPSPTATTPSGPAPCATSALKVTVSTSGGGAAAGSTYYPVDFTNTSGSACAMYGYPGVSFVTAGSSAGTQIGAAAQENPAFGKLTVRLAPGGAAHAWLQVAAAGNYPASTCQPQTVNWLKVFPPDATVAIYVSHSFDACASTGAPLLFVMPVRAGQGVRGVTP